MPIPNRPGIRWPSRTTFGPCRRAPPGPSADSGGPTGRYCARPGTTILTISVVSLAGCSGVQTATNPKSVDAALVASLWWGMLVVGSLILLAVIILLLLALLRGWRESGWSLDVRQGWILVAAGGIALPVLTVTSLVVVSSLVGREVATARGEPAVDIEVIGRLWWWEVNYRDANGEVIATTANEIHIPVNQPVRFALTSDNVIHSFWVPNLQGKTDLIPGQVNESWVEAAETGVYRGQCAEFCGVQHTHMAFLVSVEPQEDFQDWLDRQAEAAAKPTDPATRRGREVFLSSGCPACHTVRGTPAAGTRGPDLTHLAGRRTLAAGTFPNNRGHLAGWISNPQNLKPGALMPATALEPERLQDLLSYLESLQ